MIRVLIGDDHTLVRDGLCRLLAETRDIAVVAEADSGDGVLERLETTPLDVVLLDIAMPGKGFLEVLRVVRERHPKVKVIILSTYAEEEYAIRALKAGAKGYVTKDRTPEELVEAIRKASQGLRYVSESLAQQLAAQLDRDTEDAAHESLSDREYQVLQLLGAGRSVKEIAAILSVSAKTVSTYRERILEKLDLKTTADLIRYAVRRGLSE
jgi:RNA polymerase sigma factor (sigma-70 family)